MSSPTSGEGCGSSLLRPPLGPRPCRRTASWSSTKKTEQHLQVGGALPSMMERAKERSIDDVGERRPHGGRSGQRGRRWWRRRRFGRSRPWHRRSPSGVPSHDPYAQQGHHKNDGDTPRRLSSGIELAQLRKQARRRWFRLHVAIVAFRARSGELGKSPWVSGTDHRPRTTSAASRAACLSVPTRHKRGVENGPPVSVTRSRSPVGRCTRACDHQGRC